MKRKNKHFHYFVDSASKYNKYSWQDVKCSLWPDKTPKNFRITSECDMCGNLRTKFISGEVWDICDDCLAEYTYAELKTVLHKKAQIRALREKHDNHIRFGD